jgi:hypothetical protein
MGAIDEANGWLMGSSVPSCSFLNLGDEHHGQIMAVEMGQQRDPANNKPKTWDDGSPMMQMIITLQTDERDQQAENDSGVRKLYVGSKGMREALSTAVKKSGAGGVGIGGKLGMKFLREGEATNRAFNPPKEYVARYEAPTHPVDDDYDEGPPAGAPTGASTAYDPGLDDYGEEPF